MTRNLISFSLYLFGLAAFIVISGCPAITTPVCTVIKVADDTCAVLSVTLPDGGVQSLPISTVDLKQFALEQQLKAAASGMKKDGGK